MHQHEPDSFEIESDCNAATYAERFLRALKLNGDGDVKNWKGYDHTFRGLARMARDFPDIPKPHHKAFCICTHKIVNNAYIIHKNGLDATHVEMQILVVGTSCINQFLPRENRVITCSECGDVTPLRKYDTCKKCRDQKARENRSYYRNHHRPGRSLRKKMPVGMERSTVRYIESAIFAKSLTEEEHQPVEIQIEKKPQFFDPDAERCSSCNEMRILKNHTQCYDCKRNPKTVVDGVEKTNLGYIIPFGKHKGKKLSFVIETDLQYVKWLMRGQIKAIGERLRKTGFGE